MALGRAPGTKSLQFALNKCYRSVTGTTLAVDGYFSSATKAALIKVQKYVGAYPDGVFGNDTRDRMDWPMYTRSSTGTYTLQTYCGSTRNGQSTLGVTVG